MKAGRGEAGKARLTLAVWDDLAKLGEKVPVAVFYAELEPALWKQSGSRLLTLTGRTASPASPQQVGPREACHVDMRGC